ncbi:type II toxin-antitoxin system RelE/ParE family toxin [Rubneribacter badeniensis]|jgi:Plasmid stabilisation system protein.|uniref:Type II toxin-antitoxin system RelE/ParE family toxin n=1 Tax=Rubneribacter badeniensis TaxID=2070688 RepID=A0A2K2U3A9_9ACTN|nr:type II toxin-antitoxin system RelE/ParE family toxin [Rubneribacter badeniensis]PNV64769.1 type II toxin-antitoxin system RelE/ParE family toxin [Rubneribacter badeniensis]CVH80234.1 Plasmid stabilization system protein [Coriobacteriaceae bacterium CHKCI002]HJH43718.1 type II toxin-antitoxin system RelE/ParE family toxin [Rubneribacter badeniensis]
MAYTVSKSHCFEEDYDSILAYLLNELKAPRAALTLMGEVEKALDLLERDPFIHAVSRLPALGAGGCREHLVKNYRIVYKVRGSEVYLLRMFHQAQSCEGVVTDWEYRRLRD